MDLGNLRFPEQPGIRDVEINRQRRRREIGVPQGVTAITEHGLRIPCDITYDGTRRYGPGMAVPAYKIKAEMDWRNHKLIRIEVKQWPDNVEMVLDFGGEPGDMPPSWVHEIEWVEVK